MPSTVVVKMNTCNKTHRITVSMRDDGDMDVEIETDCFNVKDYARRLNRISLEDVTDFCNSKIVAPDIRIALSVPCLCPMGVFNAAWQECGMLSKRLCSRVGSNEIILSGDTLAPDDTESNDVD